MLWGVVCSGVGDVPLQAGGDSPVLHTGLCSPLSLPAGRVSQLGEMPWQSQQQSLAMTSLHRDGMAAAILLSNLFSNLFSNLSLMCSLVTDTHPHTTPGRASLSQPAPSSGL